MELSNQEVAIRIFKTQIKKYFKEILIGYKYLYRFDYQKNLNQYYKEIESLINI